MFSEAEFQGRIKRVGDAMAELGLGAVVVLDIESPTGGGNVRYMTNFSNPLPQTPAAAVIVPPDVTLCVPPGFFDSAFRVAGQRGPWLKEVTGTRHGFWGADFGKDIKSALDKAGLAPKAKVGIDGLGQMPENLAGGIRAALRDLELVEETGIVERARLVKSPAECEAIREASRLADIGITAFMDSLKAGDPQYLSANNAEHAARAQGAGDAFVYMAGGIPWFWGKYRGSQAFREGDMVCAEFNAIFEGYYGQLCRSCVIGKPSKKQRHILETAQAAYQEMAALVKPGVKASELFAAGDKVIVAAGFEAQPIRAGHGMGLTMAEGFDIFGTDHTALQPGFYLEIHVMVGDHKEAQCAVAGDALLVTESGYKALNKAEFRLEA